MGEEEGAVVRQIAKERKRKNTEKGETNTGHKYVLNSMQAHMLVPKTKLQHFSGKGRLTGEQVDAIKRDLQVYKSVISLGLGYIVYHVFGYLGLFPWLNK